MTVKEKAERYDKALEIARQYWNNRAMPIGTNFQLTRMFPELIESEDERIRNEMLQIAKESEDSFYMVMTPNKRERLIAWLEKQHDPQITDAEMKEILRTEYEKGRTDALAEQKCTAEEVLIKAGLKPYKDGDQWCILLGDNIQEGICGFGDTIDDALYAFLNDLIKSQKEQKPTDKVVPKFKVGDTIKHLNGNVFHIARIDGTLYISDEGATISFGRENDWELIEQKPAEPKFKVGDFVIYNRFGKNKLYNIVKINERGYYVNMDDVPNGILDFKDEVFMRLWTIQDAKDGDVLVSSDASYIVLFKELSCLEDNIDRFKSYCHRFRKGTFWPIEDPSWGCNAFHPATKEQRDTLFKAMADARYTFDFEKKELKKIEQEKNMDNKLTNFEHSLKHIMEEAIECGDTHNLKADADMLLRLAQKPNEWHRENEQNLNAWTEGDEKQARQIERIVHNDGCSKKLQEQIANWFESLKNRMHPKVEWSKEDEGYFKTIAHALSVLLVDPYFDEIKLKHTGWFSSLKERYTWKPTEEQIETLKCACGGNYVDLGILESLYKDLKKL